MKTIKILSITLAFLTAILVGIIADREVVADGVSSTGSLYRDANHVYIQNAPFAVLSDNSANAKTITNLALTTNVVTLTTSAAHGYLVGDKVVVALLTGPTLFVDCNGTFVIASTPTTTTFTYALTHANIVTGAATGTSTVYHLSPIVTGTSEIKFVFPPKAFGLNVIPTDAADATWSNLSGGTISSNANFGYLGGTMTMTQGGSNFIPGVEGDIVWIQRTSTTKLNFSFATTR